MNTTLTAALGLGLLALGAPARTATLEPDRTPGTVEVQKDLLPAGTTVIAHVDVERMRKSTLGRLVLANRDELDLERQQMIEELGFDPLEEIHSITAYGAGEGAEPDTLLVHGSSAIARAIEGLEAEEGFARMQAEGMEILAYEDAYAHVEELQSGDRLVILSESVDAVVAGARVVHGETASLADTREAALHIAPRAGSFLFFAAADGSGGVQGFQPASQVLGLAQGIQFDLGEAGDSVFAHLALATGSVEAAQDVADTVDGILALVRMAARSMEELPIEARQLLRSLRVNTRGDMVTVDVEYAVEALFGILQDLEAAGAY
jgi:hypothetical protein